MRNGAFILDSNYPETPDSGIFVFLIRRINIAQALVDRAHVVTKQLLHPSQSDLKSVVLLIDHPRDRQNMNYLLPGVTGYCIDEYPTPWRFPTVSYVIFKTLCHTAGRMMNARVRMVEQQLYCNFWVCYFSSIQPNRKYVILANDSYPFLAFCQMPMGLKEGEQGFEPFSSKPFIEPPELKEAFRQVSDWIIVPLDVLTMPVASADMSRLNVFERRMVKHFETERVGDIIFNCYD